MRRNRRTHIDKADMVVGRKFANRWMVYALGRPLAGWPQLGLPTADELEFLNEEALEAAGFDSEDYTAIIRESEPKIIVRLREALWPKSTNLMKTGEG